MAKNIPFILVLVMLLPVLTHCGKSHPYHGRSSYDSAMSPRGHWFSPPQKPAPSHSAPATQHPYSIDGIMYYPLPSAKGFSERGIASWYGPGFHGRKTSNGETYDMYEMTAAHKTLPMDTKLLVKNLENGAQAVVRINDRGPFIDGRIIDLSHSAARTLGIVEHGTARVKITALDGTDLAQAETQTQAEAEEKADRPITRRTAAKVTTRGRAQAQTTWEDYFIQVDAFERQQEARRLQQRFAGYGHHANLYRDHDGAITVVLFVGNDADQARREHSKLVRLGYTRAKVISVAN